MVQEIAIASHRSNEDARKMPGKTDNHQSKCLTMLHDNVASNGDVSFKLTMLQITITSSIMIVALLNWR